MHLSDAQLALIKAWAEATPQVHQVRLFGSYAKGCAHEDSDVDLAVDASARNWAALAHTWRQDLSEALGLTVKVHTLANKVVRRSCLDCSVVLFHRDAHDLFFDLAFQYYVAGRAAYFLGLSTVPGNLLHHAIEMALKGNLSRWRWNLGGLRILNHRLLDVWEAFKGKSGDASWSKYDGVVEALHQFEEIRYPDLVLEQGMMVTIGLARPSNPLPSKPALHRTEPRYELYLQEVDELFVSVCRVGRNLKTFTVGNARESMRRENLMASELP